MSYDERILQIIVSPVMTEKTTNMSGDNKYGFQVLKTATKFDVKNAVEKLFKVKVKAVNILNRKGKVKTRGKITGVQSTKKIAYVSLQDGHAINLADN
jgi:large subunit ribosomal protein L23